MTRPNRLARGPHFSSYSRVHRIRREGLRRDQHAPRTQVGPVHRIHDASRNQNQQPNYCLEPRASCPPRHKEAIGFRLASGAQSRTFPLNRTQRRPGSELESWHRIQRTEFHPPSPPASGCQAHHIQARRDRAVARRRTCLLIQDRRPAAEEAPGIHRRSSSVRRYALLDERSEFVGLTNRTCTAFPYCPERQSPSAASVRTRHKRSHSSIARARTRDPAASGFGGSLW